MRTTTLFRYPDGEKVDALRDWHEELRKPHQRGERARLKRARTPEAAAMAPGFHQLLRLLKLAPPPEPGELPVKPRQLAALAATAALAARIEEHRPGIRLGSTLRGPDPNSPRVSEIRFRRLVALEEDPPGEGFEASLAERFTVLRRLVDLIGKQADLAEIAGALCDWTAHRKRRLAYDYYATSSAPSEETER